MARNLERRCADLWARKPGRLPEWLPQRYWRFRALGRFRTGFGAAALLGLLGAGVGSAIGKGLADDTCTPQPTADEKCSEDAAFFREVLKEGRTLIVVRTESQETASVACGIHAAEDAGGRPPDGGCVDCRRKRKHKARRG